MAQGKYAAQAEMERSKRATKNGEKNAIRKGKKVSSVLPENFTKVRAKGFEWGLALELQSRIWASKPGNGGQSQNIDCSTARTTKTMTMTDREGNPSA